jgi:hypothetical protein
MKFAIINIAAARFSIVVVVGVITLGAFLASMLLLHMHSLQPIQPLD